MALLPHARTLVERHADQPFALIGVDVADGTRTVAAARLEEEGVTWQNAIDDESPVSLAARWNVRTVPRLFLLDRQGIIRRRWLGPPPHDELDRAVEELLR